MKNRLRSLSVNEVDHEEASGILGDVFRESNVYLGGSSFGKGLKTAARYYLHERMAKAPRPLHLDYPGAANLDPACEQTPLEESFYVVDLGVVVSQVYQWRRFFPRIEPFYAVKCNPDPHVVKTLAILGCNFDCASRNEIRLVQEATKDLPHKPEIIYANPCKARAHLIEAVCKGVEMVTFDNIVEIQKCAAVSKKIQLILRIITDDRGSQCRFSSKFGAPPNKWRPLLAAAKHHGLQVVGVSFHVGSGCRDASKYELALKDARKIFDMAKREFGMNMNIIDIGGGFPGETHSIWNPAVEIDEQDDDKVEGKAADSDQEDKSEDRFMCFKEIATKVAPVIDDLFSPSSGVRVIAEPGRFFVAAAATLCCSVVAARTNEMDGTFEPVAINDKQAAKALDGLTRENEKDLVYTRGRSFGDTSAADDNIMSAIQEELTDYSKMFATQQLSQQEFDVYNDKLDLYEEGFKTAIDLLGPPEPEQLGTQHHTAEGMAMTLVAATADPEGGHQLTLAAAGEAAMNGMILQAVADLSPLQDDYAYYINDGVYGAFNNLMFDHAHVRPRVLQKRNESRRQTVQATIEDGFFKLESSFLASEENQEERSELFASTVFGPTCDSIDVISRTILLPKLSIGDWMYFHNMGAYTMAAASSFNGFNPSEKFYVCSVQPEYFEEIIKGPEGASTTEEQSKDDSAGISDGSCSEMEEKKLES